MVLSKPPAELRAPFPAALRRRQALPISSDGSTAASPEGPVPDLAHSQPAAEGCRLRSGHTFPPYKAAVGACLPTTKALNLHDLDPP